MDSDLANRGTRDHVELMEREVDEAAAEWLVPRSELDAFAERAGPNFPVHKINQFANRIAIHPSVIVGQLHYLGLMPWSRRNELCPKIREHFLATSTSDGYLRKK
jgi:HTH-type transcriptional regulator / antitoxin HigA